MHVSGRHQEQQRGRRDAGAEPKPAAALFYGFSRQCSRRPFLLAKGPPIWAIRVHRAPLSSTSVVAAPQPATPSTRTLLYSRIKTGPGGNFVPKFITQSCTVPWPRGKSPKEYRGAKRQTPSSRYARLAVRPLRLFIVKLSRFIARTMKRVLDTRTGTCVSLARSTIPGTLLASCCGFLTEKFEVQLGFGMIRMRRNFHIK